MLKIIRILILKKKLTIKMKLDDVEDNTYIDFKKEVNNQNETR